MQYRSWLYSMHNYSKRIRKVKNSELSSFLGFQENVGVDDALCSKINRNGHEKTQKIPRG